jgi:hypothetical protein
MASAWLSDRSDVAPRAARLMAEGGDARIVLDPANGTNRYGASPWPREAISYASSTANDISPDAFAHVEALLAATDSPDSPETYAAELEAMRRQLRATWGLSEDIGVVFAPSGTDLEYVALAGARGRAPGGVHAILLGADEVGSGCIHSARGAYFAEATALGHRVAPGVDVAGMGPVSLVDVSVRCGRGKVCSSAKITAAFVAEIEAAHAAGKHPLVHVVHGSKTGLILPALADVDMLRARYGDRMSLVVDACQARITRQALAGWLARGATVLLTGSKFMGGPPFSGFALVPPNAVPQPPLPAGFATIFARGEWPADWAGVEALPARANPGLWLRLAAALFELERFQRLPIVRVARVILAFHGAVRAAMVDRLGGHRIAPYPPGERSEADSHPIEMRTLSTIDLSGLPGEPDLDAAVAMHKALMAQGIRLGQPVRCVPLGGGRWGATLRIGLSMPQIVALDGLDNAALSAKLEGDMARIAGALERARP